MIEGNGSVVTAFLTLFTLISFFLKVENKGLKVENKGLKVENKGLKVEKKGKERRHTWGELLGKCGGKCWDLNMLLV